MARGKWERSARVPYGALLLLAASCQLVAGIQSRKADPIAPTCSLPSGDGPQVRIANLVPNGDPAVDVCMRPSGSSSWGHTLLLEGGESGGTASCQPGFAYGHVSVAFTAPAQTIDVKLVAYGQTCDAAALTETDAIALAGPIDTLLRVGGAGGQSEQIVDFPEEDKPDPADVLIRVIHAAPATGALDFGTTTAPILPTTLNLPFLGNSVAFTQSPATYKSLVGMLDARGYLHEIPSPFNLGAATHGDASKKALFVANLTKLSQASYSIYVVGASGDNAHPLRAVVCNEDPAASNDAGNGPQEMPGCTFSALSTISIDTFNPALYGGNAPIQNQRLPFIEGANGAIAGRDSDVMCLVEVDDPQQQQQIIHDASGSFPYSYTAPQTTLDTPFNDPKEQNGQTPPTPTSPPCGGASLQMQATQAIQCLEQNCSTAGPTDGTGTLKPSDGSSTTGTACIVNSCTAPFAPLLYGDPTQQACFDCLVDYAASTQELGAALTACTTDPRPPLSYVGNNSSIILSRHPIDMQKTAIYVLPATNFRRSVLYAQIQLEDAPVDFYCGFFTSTLVAPELPYWGNYGAGGMPTDASDTGGYGNEQHYQADQLVAWVKQNSAHSSATGGPTPAIIAGEWRSSLASPNGAVGDLSPTTLKKLNAAFTPATAMKWTPQCDYCPAPANPYNPGDSNIMNGWFTKQTFIYNWTGNAASATTDESIIFTENKVPLPAALATDGGGFGPVSPYYGVNVRILRPSVSQ